jgi:hypothetical protein
MPCIRSFANACKATPVNPPPPFMSTPTQITRQVTQARQSPRQQAQQLTEQILTDAAVKKAAATAAAQITSAHLTDDELQDWRQDREARLTRIGQNQEQDLGHVEEDKLARCAKEPLRLLAERAAQVKANATVCQCIHGHGPLTQHKYLARGVDSRFGRMTIWRGYGWCVLLRQACEGRRTAAEGEMVAFFNDG